MPRPGKTGTPVNREAAEAIALQGLAFLAGDAERLRRFVMVTGLDPRELRARADSAELLSAVLDYLAGDESLLLVFTSSRGIAPQSIAAAIALLAAPAP
jgi:uncharacterized protein DUF3572